MRSVDNLHTGTQESVMPATLVTQPLRDGNAS